MSNNKRIYLITGANRGIGKGIVEMILKKNEINNNIIISSRILENSKKTYGEFCEKYPNQVNNLDFIKLDIDSISDVMQCNHYIKNKYGYLSVLFNNAAIVDREVDSNPKSDKFIKNAIQTLSINYFSQVYLTETLKPLILKAPKSTNPHIVFLSSNFGRRSFENQDMMNLFNNVKNLKDLDEIYNKYLTDIMQGNLEKWKTTWTSNAWSYCLSKTMIDCYMQIIAKELENSGILSNCFDPGWVKTDMGGKEAPSTVEDSVETASFLDEIKIISKENTGKICINKKLISV